MSVAPAVACPFRNYSYLNVSRFILRIRNTHMYANIYVSVRVRFSVIIFYVYIQRLPASELFVSQCGQVYVKSICIYVYGWRLLVVTSLNMINESLKVFV